MESPSLTSNVLLFQNFPISSRADISQVPDFSASNFFTKQTLRSHFTVENHTVLCLLRCACELPSLSTVLAGLQDYFVRSVFLVVRAESLKIETVYSM